MANYLYNGIPLPDINDGWDKETYPHLYLVPHEEENYVFCAGNSTFTVSTDGEISYTGAAYYLSDDGTWTLTALMAYTAPVLWTNTDLYTTDGTLYLPATAPIPVSTATTWKYNGVELPALPVAEWDMETYPYAFIIDGTAIRLYLTSSLPVANTHTNANGTTADRYEISTAIPVYKVVDGAWIYSTTYSSANFYLDEINWANFSVVGVDGTTYLALSSPEPVVPEAPPVTTVPIDFNPACYILGRQFGKRIIAQRKPKKPVAYLYNGVQLPALPEWDKTVYPYAVILWSNYSGYYFLYCSNHRPFHTVDSDGTQKLFIGSRRVRTHNVDGAWVEFTEYSGYSGATLSEERSSVVWANFDIIADDGSVYQAAGVTNDPNVSNASVDYFVPDQTATAWVLNGIELPVPPKFDANLYPYMILVTGSNRYELYISRCAKDKQANTADYQYVCAYWIPDNVWYNWTDYSGVYNPAVNTNQLWANHNCYDTDGTLYLEATEIIPVYE